MTAGFIGGGGIDGMEVSLSDGRNHLWVPKWDVWNRQAPEGRIWRVKYGCLMEEVADCGAPAPDDLSNALVRLGRALREIHAFSSTRGCDGFSECFSKALDTLDSAGANLHGYHKDLVPVSCRLPEARTLLDACQSAWVFGGMGSWNDMGFHGDDENEYELISANLYGCIKHAICAGANDSGHRFGRLSC